MEQTVDTVRERERESRTLNKKSTAVLSVPTNKKTSTINVNKKQNNKYVEKIVNETQFMGFVYYFLRLCLLSLKKILILKNIDIQIKNLKTNYKKSSLLWKKFLKLKKNILGIIKRL